MLQYTAVLSTHGRQKQYIWNTETQQLMLHCLYLNKANIIDGIFESVRFNLSVCVQIIGYFVSSSIVLLLLY